MARSYYYFIFPFRIRHAETDAHGIVFYGYYQAFFDTAIYENLRALPFDYMNHVKQTVGIFGFWYRFSLQIISVVNIFSKVIGPNFLSRYNIIGVSLGYQHQFPQARLKFYGI
jgi:hypothetical protein